MEKRKRTHDLENIKKAFSTLEQLGLCTTLLAFQGAQELGFTRSDMVDAIQVLKSADFYKSMTSFADHKTWQDVYHLKFHGKQLYIKFSVKPNGQYLLLSFKEK